MAVPSFQPISNTSRVALPITGTFSNVNSSAVPFGVYLSDSNFISGAVAQVSFTYKMLGGDVIDIELTEQNVYTAYEKAVLEYSRIINMHQAKNVLSDFLGFATGTFDHTGEFSNLPSGSSLSGTNPSLIFPKFTFSYSRRISDGIAGKAGIGSNVSLFSASVTLRDGVQTYDLQAIVSQSANTSNQLFTEIVQNNPNKRIRVHRVFYNSPTNMWRFYGYYGGLSVVGNLNTYGQYADDSTFEIVPVWQNKLQSLMFETNLYTRASHYSYEIHNNRLKIYPPPTTTIFNKVWFEFSIDEDPWIDNISGSAGVNGINNVNTLPFANIPFVNINSIGKDWIRDFALAICKSMLAQIRGKFTTIPIPNNDITLNWAQLEAQAKEEMQDLRDRLKEDLDQLAYHILAERDAQMVENAKNVEKLIPTFVYVG